MKQNFSRPGRAWMIAAVACLVLAACEQQGPATASRATADLVLINGGIYTVDAGRSWAEALAVSAGEIIAVGSNDLIAGYTGDNTRVIDLTGRMALPGFNDGHIHAINGGEVLLGCSLQDAYSPNAILDMLEDCAVRQPEGWLVGLRFDLALFDAPGPGKELLDARFPDRPVFVMESSKHSAWVNSRAMQLAGITAQTPDPPEGRIQRKGEDGEPQGMLLESATRLVQPFLPERTQEKQRAELNAALEYLNAFGVTAINEIAYEENAPVYRDAELAGELTVRVTTSLVYGPWSEHSIEAFETLLAERMQQTSPLVDARAVKIFLDGVLEGESAALVDPYEGMGEHRGELKLSPQEMADLVQRFDAMGLQVHVHALGDGAVRVALDAFEAARDANGAGDNRHHLVHLQLVHPDDYARFGALDVTANFQAAWAYPDAWITELNLPVVGQARVDRMYPINSIHQAGGRIVGGSDWSVSTPNPLVAIETAVTRQDPTGEIPLVLNPLEKVGLATMLDAYTINAAWLMHREQQTGSLEKGKRADIVVLESNLFDIPAAAIGEVEVLWTIFDGQVVFEASRAQDQR